MTKFDIHSNDNSLFVTGQCNNRCLMCCQPPVSENDIEHIMRENLDMLKNSPLGLSDIGITGGEPTLLKDKLFFLIKKITDRYPEATIHILTNGREFRKGQFTVCFSQYPQILFGIPLHSDISTEHDYVTQVEGSYYETMRGLYQLAAINAKIELRIVITRQNYQRLFNMSDFIWKNLPFVSYISFMGLEDTGYAIKNEKKIWIDPILYKQELEKAVLNLNDWHMNVSIFNIPLCLLPNSLHIFARKSISDWKVKYLEVCTKCNKRIDCCGLFATSKRQSDYISPIIF
ncbi:MAG: His-Xaa-Ser system radical SAM maturase HxsC [Treponema sp.]|nr:His-Xaa-Ser system radical SAM maturase HxsC [Treponema sp.]